MKSNGCKYDDYASDFSAGEACVKKNTLVKTVDPKTGENWYSNVRVYDDTGASKIMELSEREYKQFQKAGMVDEAPPWLDKRMRQMKDEVHRVADIRLMDKVRLEIDA